MKKSTSYLQILYTLLTITLPVMSIYVSPFPGIDFGTLCVLLFSVFMLINKPSIKLNRLLVLLLIYSFVVTIPLIMGLTTEYYSSTSSVLNRLFRFIILTVMMVGFGYTTYFDEKNYTRVLGVASLIVASYAIIQAITFRFLGFKLRNIFWQERGGAVFSSTLGEYESVYRPPSFFLEPSGVTYFLTPFLCYILFRKKTVNGLEMLSAIIITIGILVSTSGQGLFVISICWGGWGIRQLRGRKFMGLLIILICSFLFLRSYDLNYTVSRITTDEELNAIDARSGGYELVKDLPDNRIVFGTGYGNYVESIYYSSFAEIVFCTGIVGLLIVLLFYFSLFNKGVLYQKVLVISSLVLMIGGGIYTPTYLCFYLPMLLPVHKKEGISINTKGLLS